MSTITASACPARTLPPTRLAAGPESRVSTGYSLAISSDMRLPSLRIIARGIFMFRSSITCFTAWKNSAISGISRVFKRVPAPLRSTSTSSDISQAVVTGTPSFFFRISLAVFSKRPPLALGKACSTPTAPHWANHRDAFPSSSSQSGSCGCSKRCSGFPSINISSSGSRKP